MPLDAIAAIGRRIPPGAIVLVDEAYVEYGGRASSRSSRRFQRDRRRTFSKGYGLAALRIGCLIGAPDTLDPIVRAIPVYSVNIAAVVGLQAALADPAYWPTTVGRWTSRSSSCMPRAIVLA